ncbi:hypothetical protein BS007_RS17140 [Vibrio parahaemolyticus]|nr:hypothetical protein [Vibrio parahaemolyticus]HCG9703134.1 hypothetical protein [Vibrio parahaemolyticus]
MSAPLGNLNNCKFKPEYAKQVYKLCLLGARDVELADFFEVHRDTIFHWCKLYPEFAQARKKGKMQADAEVAHCLFQRATGMTLTQQKVTHRGEVVDYQQELPADVRAMEYWLKCRNRDAWNPKNQVELSGSQANPLAFLLTEMAKEAEDASPLPNKNQLNQ